MAGYLGSQRCLIITALLPILGIFLYQVVDIPRPTKFSITAFNQSYEVLTFTMPSQTRKTHFRTIQKFGTNYSPATISQYVSARTGMHCVVVDQKGPKVHGYFTLATEIFDNSGAPHTLEHLVFMGSKNYQYKGLLDKLATRAYSNTNAWTATDHTAYTLDTAGWEGFAQILPVYLEHVLVPTLTDAGCYTEVHHIDGEGKDAGVVYSEMQGIENTGGEILDIKARDLLYPENVGFRYETGGLMGALRVLKADRIREFHKEMYQPRNLCLVIVGEVDHDDLLQILDDFEDSILDDIPPPNAPFKRPWIDSAQPPALQKTVVETVEFPEEDESVGEVLVGLFGPNCTDSVAVSALNVLLTYLAGSSVSVLENTLVEQEELASAIGYWWDARPSTVIWFHPTSVATEKLDYVEKRLFQVLQKVASEPLDMKYLQDCLRRERRQIKFQSESSSSFYATGIINDFLFGNRDGSTLRDFSTDKEYDTLENWSEDQWKGFLKKWITDAPHISVLAKPSKALAVSIKSKEEARIAARRAELGPDGLKKKARELKDAIAKNDVEIPAIVLQKWPVPGVESIHFIESLTARSGLAKKMGTQSNVAQSIIDKSNANSPLFIQFEHVPTNFVHLTLLLGTSQVATELRPLLTVFMDNFFNTPIMRGGKRLGFEQVVTELEQDTISYSIGGGGRVGDTEGLAIQFQIEPDKYSTAIEWIRTMMFDSIIDEARLKAAIAKILADVPDQKRNGNNMVHAVDAALHLENESSVKARGTLVRGVYMKRLKKLLADDPMAVISNLEKLRKSLFMFNNMRVLVVANVEKLPSPVESWNLLISDLDKTQPLLPIVKQIERLNENGKKPGQYGAVVVPMTTIDSSFLLASAKGPSSYTDPVVPALMVTLAFLEAVEGPLWTSVRGTGLAYGASFRRDPEGGFVQFSVYRSPDAYRAFNAAKKVIEEFISGVRLFEEHALEGAISSIVVGFADEQTTMASAGQSHFVDIVIRGVDPDYNTRMLKEVRDIGREEIKQVMKDILLPAFTPGKANIVVTCAPIMKEGIVKAFQESGFKAQTHPLSHFQEDYGLKGDDEDEDEDDDEDVGEGGDDDDTDDSE